MVPYEPKLIDFNLLDRSQKAWLNDYNRDINENIVPILEEEGDVETVAWIKTRIGRLTP